MKNKKEQNKKNLFENFASAVSRAAGSTGAFIGACSIIVVWLITGPLFHYSEVWQLMINTGTTIITFLMVFVIQKAQNKDSLAIQLKLNELVASNELASNRLISVEDMTEDELRILQKFYSHLAVLTKKEGSMIKSHSIDEAEKLHAMKEHAYKNKTRKLDTK